MKPKNCVHCGKSFIPYTSVLKMCSINCALEYNREHKKVEEYLKQKEKKEWGKQKKVMKAKLKTLGEYEKEAKSVFQLWIRLRDKDLPCISCGTNDSPMWDAGHYMKAELYSGLIFDPDNCHRQCRKCNYYLDGNEANYRIGLVKRYGVEFVARIESVKDQSRTYKYSKQELIDIKEKYRELIKQLKKAA